MMSTTRTRTLGRAARLGCLALTLLLAAPPWALARGGPQHGGPGGSGGRGGYPQVVPSMPRSHQVYNHGGKRWYGWGGLYYRPYGPGYRVAPPPRGLFVTALPIGFATLVIAGLTYYTFAGIYYRPAPGGYVVVETPPNVVIASPPPAPVVAPSAPQGTAMVTAALLNVRSGPGPGYPVLFTVSQGFDLTIYGQSPGWLYVQSPDGRFGWVDQRFTSLPATATPSG